MISILYNLFGFLALLFPLAIYLLILAVLNGRRRPTMISGAWDFAGVLFATSGFLLIGGPLILTGLNTQFRGLLLQGRTGALKSESFEWWFFWIFVSILYFAGVLGGAAYLLWRRRTVTVIYNAESALVEEALSRALERLGLEGGLVGNRLYLGERGTSADDPPNAPVEAIQAANPSTQATSSAAGLPQEESTPAGVVEELSAEPPAYLYLGRSAILELEPFPSVHHVTLRWCLPPGEDAALRRDLETELARALGEMESSPNPVTGWLLTIASCLFLLMLIGLALLILLESKRN